MISNKLKKIKTKYLNCDISKSLKGFAEDNNGIGVVELILILVVLIGLVVIFRDQLTTIITNIFGRIAADSASI